MTVSLIQRRPWISYWKCLVFILAPIVWTPIFAWQVEDRPQVPKVTYVILIMATYWVTECIPLQVTSLMPLFMFPLLLVLPAKTVASAYITDSSWLFIGGLLIAVMVEEVNLHRRIALTILNISGSTPGRLMFGVTIASSFLSMFISNTATTAMMMPVVLSLAGELIRTRRSVRRVTPAEQNGEVWKMQEFDTIDANTTVTDATIATGANTEDNTHSDENRVDMTKPETLSKSETKMTKAMLIAVAYSASLGGTATLTGTLPNVVMKGLLDQAYGTQHPITYGSWMLYNFPGMIINLCILNMWLQLVWFGPGEWLRTFNCCCTKVGDKRAMEEHKAVDAVLKGELKKLGRIKFAEISVLAWYCLALILWFTRQFPGGGGWGSLFIGDDGKSTVSDATVIMIAVVVLFCWPRELGPKYRPLITWQRAKVKLPWGVAILLGGGFAIAKAVKSSGLSVLIADQLAKLQVSNAVLVLISLFLMTHLTEFTSNTATSQIVLPITMKLAEKRCINPLYLTMPVSEAASFAYMLPVATPPNAIIFGSNMLRVVDLIMCGFVMNFVCMGEVMLSIHTWGWHMFGIEHYPEWAANVTGTAACVQ